MNSKILSSVFIVHALYFLEKIAFNIRLIIIIEPVWPLHTFGLVVLIFYL